MKNLFLSALILISLSCIGQNVVRDANGNFTAISSHKTDSLKATLTTYVYTDKKGEKYPVYVTTKGKYFISRTSAKGNVYKFYLKP